MAIQFKDNKILFGPSGIAFGSGCCCGAACGCHEGTDSTTVTVQFTDTGRAVGTGEAPTSACEHKANAFSDGETWASCPWTCSGSTTGWANDIVNTTDTYELAYVPEWEETGLGAGGDEYRCWWKLDGELPCSIRVNRGTDPFPVDFDWDYYRIILMVSNVPADHPPSIGMGFGYYLLYTNVAPPSPAAIHPRTDWGLEILGGSPLAGLSFHRADPSEIGNCVSSYTTPGNLPDGGPPKEFCMDFQIAAAGAGGQIDPVTGDSTCEGQSHSLGGNSLGLQFFPRTLMASSAGDIMADMDVDFT